MSFTFSIRPCWLVQAAGALISSLWHVLVSHSLGCGPDEGCPNKWDELDYDTSWQILYSYHKQRYLSFAIGDKKKGKENKSWGQDPQWFISGASEKEGFDPLEFSKKNGIH